MQDEPYQIPKLSAATDDALAWWIEVHSRAQQHPIALRDLLDERANAARAELERRGAGK